jgi:hypothetical protein
LPGQNPTREYSRERRYYMDKAATKKQNARGSLLDVSGMAEKDVWKSAVGRIEILRATLADGRDPKALALAQDVQACLEWLYWRGTQLQFLYGDDPRLV